MPAYLPYLALAVLGVALLAAALRHGRDRKLLALYLTAAGATYLFEFFIMVLFNSYAYRPGLLANPYLDSLAGAVASNAVAVPTAAVAVVSFRLGAAGLLLVAAAFAAVEQLFLMLGVYQHHWWHTGYTAFLLFAAFILARLWYDLLRRQPPPTFVCIVTAYLTSLLLRATVGYLLRIFGLLFFSVGWFAIPERGHTAVYTLFVIAEAAVYAPLACLPAGRLLPPAALGFFALVLISLARAGIVLAPWWFPGFHLALSAAVFLFNRALMGWLGLAAGGSRRGQR